MRGGERESEGGRRERDGGGQTKLATRIRRKAERKSVRVHVCENSVTARQIDRGGMNGGERRDTSRGDRKRA